MPVRWRLVGGGVAVAGAAFWATLPPATEKLAQADWAGAPTVVRGAYHIHSTTSDGSGTLDEIGAAARRAGLQFAIVTDHGDGTRAPEPPRYRHGVLVVDAVEVNTAAGHLVAIGLERPAPYPLAGPAEAVVEDVHRLGGIAVAAHPASPRASLRWTDRTAAIDGIEWLNADSEWRDEAWGSLGRLLVTYPFRGAAALAAVLDRPGRELAEWDRLGSARRLVGLAAADAHARVGLRQRGDPDQASWHLPLPGYEASFRAFSNHAIVETAPTGEADRDARLLIESIAAGRVFAVIDGLATPGAFAFEAVGRERSVPMGGEWTRADGPLVLRARVAAPAGAVLTLLRDGQAIWRGAERFEVDVTGRAGVYRAEVSLGAAGRVPWLVSNPIYVREALHAADASGGAPVRAASLPAALDRAHAESAKGRSTIERAAEDEGLAWRYALDGGRPSGQFGAVAIPTDGGVAAFTHVRVRAVADRPARLWAQLRSRAGDERWGTTFYVDHDPRTVVLALPAFEAIGRASAARAALDRIESLLIVADTVNTRPGGEGAVRILAVDWLTGEP